MQSFARFRVFSSNCHFKPLKIVGPLRENFAYSQETATLNPQKLYFQFCLKFHSRLKSGQNSFSNLIFLNFSKFRKHPACRPSSSPPGWRSLRSGPPPHRRSHRRTGPSHTLSVVKTKGIKGPTNAKNSIFSGPVTTTFSCMLSQSTFEKLS